MSVTHIKTRDATVNLDAKSMKKLEDSQVESFDTEYVEDGRWDTVRARIDQDFPSGDFTFLDVGGGNGKFADCLLAQYPESTGTVLDNSEVLSARNQPNERKTVILDSVENLGHIDTKFDIVCVHWLLHHLVSDSYIQTRQNQLSTLKAVDALLTARGRVSVFENVYSGWLIENLPGLIIYHLTSAKAIRAITRRLGANTAGVGVCFLSKNQWYSTTRNAGLQILSYAEPDNWIWPLRPEWKVCLHIRRICVGHFWLSTRKGEGLP